MLEQGDFASDFHIFGLQRLPDSIRTFVDGIPIGEVRPNKGGFWELGEFDKDPTSGPNIWANGTTMTPFDYPVSENWKAHNIVACTILSFNGRKLWAKVK